MLFHIDSNNSYRLFFSFSLAGIISGLGLFIFSYSGLSIYWHRELMISLFLLPAATGFIFTAAPKFLLNTPAKQFEIWIAAILYTSLFGCFFIQHAFGFVLIKVIAIIWILFFFVSRWWGRKTKNPFWPPFILISLVAGLTGSLIQLVAQLKILHSLVQFIGTQLYFDAMFWILLFGIGIKFFPMLTGAAAPAVQVHRKSILTPKAYNSQVLWFAIAIIGVASFLIQTLVHTSLGLWIRAILILFIAYEGWGLFEKPLRKGHTTTFLQIFLYTILIGHFIFPFFPSLLVHFYHIVFVVGFLAITILVETRVLLSHEHLDTAAEQHSKWLLAAFILFYLAMILRVTAVFKPLAYAKHLQYASLAAIAAVILVLVQLRKSFNAH